MTKNDLQEILDNVNIIEDKVKKSVCNTFIALEVVSVRRIIKRLIKELDSLESK